MTITSDTSDSASAVGPVPGSDAADAASRPGSGRADFLRFLGSKLAAAAVSFVIVLGIGFVIFQLMPSDPVQTMTRGRPTSDAQMAHLRQTLGLDRPVWERFLHFVNDIVHLDLGRSWQYQQDVSSLIGERVGPTLLLMGTATAISVVVGLWLGVRSGWRHGSLFDKITSSAALTFWSVPTYWLGMILLIWLSVGLDLFPSGGMSDPSLGATGFGHVLDVARHMVLPCLTMVLVVFAQYVSIMRSSIIDELGSPYLLTARAKGLVDDAVRRKHAVPNALLPSVTVIFLHLGTMVGGAITVETVFSWPGLGSLTIEALKVPDIPVLQGTFIIFSASVILMNLLADVLYRFLDPRVRVR